MDIAGINRKVFKELGNEKQLIEYHDIIYKLVGVVVDFINADGESLKLSKMRHFNPYCEMLRSTSSGFEACQTCDRKNAGMASVKRQELIYKCYAGLLEVVVPLYDHTDCYIGCLTTGQFHIEGEPLVSKQAVSKIATTYKLDSAELYKLYKSTKVLSKRQVEGLMDFLKTIGRLIVETHNKLLFLEKIDAPDKIALIKQYVADNYMKKITIPETSKKFFFSPGHFCRFFKNEVGVSFISFVNMYRIAKAEDMLKKTSRNISEIAFLVGFGSISQFNRMFKQIKGVSPKEYNR